MDAKELEAARKLAIDAFARAEKATPGPWYPHATDDEYYQNARYVGLRPSEFLHDNRTGMAPGSAAQEPSEQVIAITLLQQPQLADIDQCDENTVFIAAARNDVPTLAGLVIRLVDLLESLYS